MRARFGRAIVVFDTTNKMDESGMDDSYRVGETVAAMVETIGVLTPHASGIVADDESHLFGNFEQNAMVDKSCETITSFEMIDCYVYTHKFKHEFLSDTYDWVAKSLLSNIEYCFPSHQ
mmetsp:Transcript_26134/g.38699  ORF Transcript_26134/g.38699 Transcript_26134/m.38699 type:complete len:119 (+) Transcript_26134:1335-1691(+)